MRRETRMADDIRIISADSHVTIPNELVHAHLPAKLKDKVAEAEKAYAAAMLAAKPQKAAQAELKKEREASGAHVGPGVGAFEDPHAAMRIVVIASVVVATMRLRNVVMMVLLILFGGATQPGSPSASGDKFVNTK